MRKNSMKSNTREETSMGRKLNEEEKKLVH